MVKVKTTASPNGAIKLEAFMAPDTAGRFTGKAASALHDLLLAELEKTDLPQSLKNQIASSIKMRTTSNGAAKISIASPAARDVEFGTRFAVEQPFITRAQMQAETLLPRLLTQTIQPRQSRKKPHRPRRPS